MSCDNTCGRSVILGEHIWVWDRQPRLLDGQEGDPLLQDFRSGALKRAGKKDFSNTYSTG